MCTAQWQKPPVFQLKNNASSNMIISSVQLQSKTTQELFIITLKIKCKNSIKFSAHFYLFN